MRDAARSAGGLPAVAGVWQYYASLAEEDLQASRLSAPVVEWAG
jgi:hypothetical protein